MINYSWLCKSLLNKQAISYILLFINIKISADLAHGVIIYLGHEGND